MPSAATAAASSASPTPTKIDISSFPPHIKPQLRRIDYAALRQLPGTAASHKKMDCLLRYVCDPSTYINIPTTSKPSEIRKAATPASFTQPLVDAGYIERCSPNQVCGSVFVFGTVEFNKRRVRIIQHPVVINDLLPMPEYDVSFKSIAERCQLVHAGAFAGTCDFSAYFTLFELHPLIRARFGCRMPVVNAFGETVYELFRLRVAPTGLRHMPAVAISVTEHLKAFDHKSAAHDDHIDNILFVGDYDAVHSDLLELGQRCDIAGVTVNEDLKDPSPLIATTLDWCGLRLNFTDKTVSLASKTTTKIELSWNLRSSWTWRGICSHIGMLRYAAAVIDCSICDFWHLHVFVSAISRWQQEHDNKRYDERGVLPDAALVDLERWTSIALANKPRLIIKDKTPDFIVTVDSSALGWGYAALDLQTKKLYSHAGTWTADFQRKHAGKLHRSVLTEPYGMLFTKQHLQQLLGFQRYRRTVQIFSDNVATIATFRRGYASRSFDMNCVAALDRHNDTIAEHSWSYVHVAGKDNIFADALSRGRMVAELAVEEPLGMREFLTNLARANGGNRIGGLQAVVGVEAQIQ